MDMTGEQRIRASRDVVWQALNDPDILKASIPGCQELFKESDTEMTAVAVIKVGPISAHFRGRVTLSSLDPPNGYRIDGEGQGGVAGHAKGGATVTLVEDEADTILHYEVSAQVGGRLAQLGGRMIDATARTMSAAFFKKFAQEIADRQMPRVAGSTDGEPTVQAKPAPRVSPPGDYDQKAADPSDRGHSAWWVLCGLLLGGLIVGLLDSPQMPAKDGQPAQLGLLTLAAILLAGIQGYLIGRQKQ